MVKESYSAIDRKDYVLLSDILEYDLSECLDHWQAFISSYSETFSELYKIT